MNKKINTLSVFSTLISCFLVIGCGGGSSSSDTPSSSDIVDSSELSDSSDTENGLSTEGGLTPTNAAVGPLSGPRLFQTGDTAVQGTQDNVAFGFTVIPSWNYSIDTDTNTVTDNLTSNGVPDLIYDEDGRAIEIQLTPTSDPFFVEYNADDSIDTITRTRTRDGEIGIIKFNYENDRLISKITTKEEDGVVEVDAEALYTYSDDGRLVSGTYETFRGFLFSEMESYAFETDTSGRVISVVITETNGLVERHDLGYDSNGNITEQNVLRGEDNESPDFPFVDFTFTYSGSAEPTVNLPGFFAATNNAFLPESEFDLFF